MIDLHQAPASTVSFGIDAKPPRRAANDPCCRIPRSVFERRAGRLLRLLKDSDGYRSLGFAHLAEYVTERLGVGNRTAQEMMRVDAALEMYRRLSLANSVQRRSV